MDKFSIYGGTFDPFLKNLIKVLCRCEEVNLVLNWKDYHFMVQEVVVSGHVIFDKGIEVNKDKIDVIERLPPTSVKEVRSVGC